MTEGVMLWKSEQKDWVNQNLVNETGHYTSMINPKYNYVGLGDFYSKQHLIRIPLPVNFLREPV